MRESRFPWLGANVAVADRGLMLNSTVLLHGMLRLGVIGLTTIHSNPPPGVLIDGRYLEIAHREAKTLRDKHNCSLVIVNCHIGSELDIPSE